MKSSIDNIDYYLTVYSMHLMIVHRLLENGLIAWPGLYASNAVTVQQSVRM